MIDVNHMVESIALKHNFHVRIIADDFVPRYNRMGLFGEPLNVSGHWDWAIKYSDVEIDTSASRWGWGKPDKVIHGVEIRYLWK